MQAGSTYVNQELIQLFLFLAGVYFINGILISFVRYLKLADFIAHLLTGVAFGSILIGWSELFGSGVVQSFQDNSLISLLSYVGLLVFLTQLGYNFDIKLFQLADKISLLHAFALIVLIGLGIGSVSYFGLGSKEIWLTIFLIIAFMSINVGNALSGNFPVAPRLKKPFTNLIRIGVILDITAVLLFTVFILVFRYQDYSITNFRIEILYWAILLLFILPVIFPRATNKLFSLLEKVMKDFALLLKLGIFFLFFYISFQVGISYLLVGVWAGMLLRSLAGSTEFTVKQKFFPIATFFYIFPFVEIGQNLVYKWQYLFTFWPLLNYILIALAIISFTFGLTVVRKKDFPLLLAFGVFPRGELCLLILWLSQKFDLLSPSIFIPAVIAVIVSTILGRLLFIRPFEREEEFT